jgi:hypothetical protein
MNIIMCGTMESKVSKVSTALKRRRKYGYELLFDLSRKF